MLVRSQAPNQRPADRTRRPGDQQSQRAPLSARFAAIACAFLLKAAPPCAWATSPSGQEQSLSCLEGVPSAHANSHCAGTTAGAPLVLIMTTMNFAGW